METRLGWRRALLAAESCDVTLLCGPGADSDELSQRAQAERGTREGLRFVQVKHDWLSGWLCSSASLYYLGYRRWNRLALEVGRKLHAANQFDLTHQINFCGYREPGLLWKLGLPFVWGPLGGTQYFPVRFLGVLDALSASKELFRNALNWWQLRYCRRVVGAARAASLVLAATTTGQRQLKQGLGIETSRQLETGLDCQIGPPRKARQPDAPLRILWAGRLQAWKAFPLLVQALGKLPESTKFQLRVLGSGPCQHNWRLMAERAGIAERTEWIEWPSYAQTLPHYRWADAFAFTSLRDTSGTGLIEALAAGTPIVGVDHQGAADIMTPNCALAAPVKTPAGTSQALADALCRLASDPDYWLKLSQGAQQRAAEFAWELRSQATRAQYWQSLGITPSPAPTANPSAASLADSAGARSSLPPAKQAVPPRELPAALVESSRSIAGSSS